MQSKKGGESQQLGYRKASELGIVHEKLVRFVGSNDGKCFSVTENMARGRHWTPVRKHLDLLLML